MLLLSDSQLYRTHSNIFKLGQWVQGFTIRDTEDVLSNFLQGSISVDFSPEVNTALAPSLPVLARTLTNPESVVNEDCPALAYTREKVTGSLRHLHSIGMVPFHGNVSDLDVARVINWLEVHIPEARSRPQRMSWITGAPSAHAITLLLASRYQDIFISLANYPQNGTAKERFQFSIAQAWERQIAPELRSRKIDVEAESITFLEERMFEVSKEAGEAGYYQWGLDVGDHQNQWSPYQTPGSWNHGDGEFEEVQDVSISFENQSVMIGR